MTKYFEGIGRRKTSTARVRIYSGQKASTVNGKSMDVYFANNENVDKLLNQPFVITNLVDKYYFTAKVSGGGINSQIDAVRLGLGRALCEADESLKPVLRKAGLLTRDPRAVERKKYHHVKARKKPQFSKR